MSQFYVSMGILLFILIASTFITHAIMRGNRRKERARDMSHQ